MFPVRIIMYTIKGLYYPKKILAGMKHAAHALPGNFLGKFAAIHHKNEIFFTIYVYVFFVYFSNVACGCVQGVI